MAISPSLLMVGSAAAQTRDTDQAPGVAGSPESFAGTFFVSRAVHADGSQTIDLFGSLLIWGLLALSAVNIGLIGYLALANQRKSIVPSGVVSEVRRLLNAGNYRQALELTKGEESFFSRIIHAGLSEANHGFAAVVRALEQTADVLITTRMRPIELLYMFGQVSPMMGLLGTVYGIIFAFRVFVAMGGRASPALLAGGIGTALVATFWGLVVAIPALAGYSILRNKVDQLTMEAITSAEEMLAPFRPKAAGAAAPAPSPKPVPPVKPVPQASS
jgi:biopolymer transport protein ExbB